MDQKLLPFYKSLHAASFAAEDTSTRDPSVVGQQYQARPARAVQIKAPVRDVNSCPHAMATRNGCPLEFRSKPCCYAVSDHECNPPKSLLPEFARCGNDQRITMAQVYIAQGCHL